MTRKGHHLAEDQPILSKTSVNRRSFFRRLFLHGANQVEHAGRQVAASLNLADDRSGLADDNEEDLSAPQSAFLRPPGALDEPSFADTCSRCGECVEACPAQCIEIDRRDPPQTAGGLPYIIPRQSPCVVCDDLACMNVCPSGALQLVQRVEQIRMGLAWVDFDRCLRTADRDAEDCRICVRHCPVGESALRVGDDGCIEVRPGCIGCGVCEWACPTLGPSIVVTAANHDPPATTVRGTDWG